MDAQWNPSRIATPTRCEATRRAPIEVVIAPVDPDVSLPFHLSCGVARRLEAGTLTPREYFNLTSIRCPLDMEFEDQYGRDGEAWNTTLRTLIGRFDRFPTIRKYRSSLPGLIEIAVSWEVSQASSDPDQGVLLETINAFSPTQIMEAIDNHSLRCRSQGGHETLLALASLLATPQWKPWTEVLLATISAAWERTSIALLAVKSLGARDTRDRIVTILDGLEQEQFHDESFVVEEIARSLPRADGLDLALRYSSRALHHLDLSPQAKGLRPSSRCFHLLYPFKGREAMGFVESVLASWIDTHGSQIAAEEIRAEAPRHRDCITLASLAAASGISWSTMQEWRRSEVPLRTIGACALFVICHPGEMFLHDQIIRDPPMLIAGPSMNELIRFMSAWESEEPDQAIRTILKRAIAHVEN